MPGHAGHIGGVELPGERRRGAEHVPQAVPGPHTVAVGVAPAGSQVRALERAAAEVGGPAYRPLRRGEDEAERVGPGVVDVPGERWPSKTSKVVPPSPCPQLPDNREPKRPGGGALLQLLCGLGSRCCRITLVIRQHGHRDGARQNPFEWVPRRCYCGTGGARAHHAQLIRKTRKPANSGTSTSAAAATADAREASTVTRHGRLVRRPGTEHLSRQGVGHQVSTYLASSYCVGCATVPSVSESTTSSNRSRYGANRNMRLRLPPVTSARISLS
jgi:hypothetical protein